MWISKTTMALCAVLITAVLLLAGPWVKADRPVHLVCDIWPPYQIQEQYSVSGLSTEIVKSVYERMGISQISIQSLPWKRALDMVRFGEADALFSANATTDRKLFLRFPDEPLFESSWIVWTKAESNIQTLEDLKGKTIGVVLGYSYTPEFWEFIETYCTVEQVHNDEINFKKLSLGRLDATVAEYGNGLYLSKILQTDGIQPQTGITIKTDGLYVVFSRDHASEDFVKDFSEELKEFKKTDEFKEIWKKYLGVAR